MVEPHTGRGLYQLDDDSGLYKAMGGAGSSYGIVTEFLYRIYPRPETLPIIAMVYLENRYDIRKMEKAAQDGRYHVSWFIGYAFRDLNVFHGNTIVSLIFCSCCTSSYLLGVSFKSCTLFLDFGLFYYLCTELFL